MCSCDLCQRANNTAVYPAPTVMTFGTIVPPQQWCGVHHMHGPHRFAAPSGFYADCPGSSCACAAAVPGPTGETT